MSLEGSRFEARSELAWFARLGTARPERGKEAPFRPSFLCAVPLVWGVSLAPRTHILTRMRGRVGPQPVSRSAVTSQLPSWTHYGSRTACPLGGGPGFGEITAWAALSGLDPGKSLRGQPIGGWIPGKSQVGRRDRLRGGGLNITRARIHGPWLPRTRAAVPIRGM